MTHSDWAKKSDSCDVVSSLRTMLLGVPQMMVSASALSSHCLPSKRMGIPQPLLPASAEVSSATTEAPVLLEPGNDKRAGAPQELLHQLQYNSVSAVSAARAHAAGRLIGALSAARAHAGRLIGAPTPAGTRKIGFPAGTAGVDLGLRVANDCCLPWPHCNSTHKVLTCSSCSYWGPLDKWTRWWMTAPWMALQFHCNITWRFQKSVIWSHNGWTLLKMQMFWVQRFTSSSWSQFETVKNSWKRWMKSAIQPQRFQSINVQLNAHVHIKFSSIGLNSVKFSLDHFKFKMVQLNQDKKVSTESLFMSPNHQFLELHRHLETFCHDLDTEHSGSFCSAVQWLTDNSQILQRVATWLRLGRVQQPFGHIKADALVQCKCFRREQLNAIQCWIKSLLKAENCFWHHVWLFSHVRLSFEFWFTTEHTVHTNESKNLNDQKIDNKLAHDGQQLLSGLQQLSPCDQESWTSFVQAHFPLVVNASVLACSHAK